MFHIIETVAQFTELFGVVFVFVFQILTNAAQPQGQHQSNHRGGSKVHDHGETNGKAEIQRHGDKAEKKTAEDIQCAYDRTHCGHFFCC